MIRLSRHLRFRFPQYALAPLVALLALALLATACGLFGSESSDTTAPTADQTTLVSAEGGATTSSASTSAATSSTTDPTDTTDPDDSEATTTTLGEPGPDGFPLQLTDDTGLVTITQRPARIVSLSPTATEMLFAIGAGPQVIAADSFSNFPPAAPTQADLSAFEPSVEAIAAFEPDLVIISFDPDGTLAPGLRAVGAEVLQYGAADSLAGMETQMRALGQATGNFAQAVAAAEDVQERIDVAVAGVLASGEPPSFYLELDPLLYSVTSGTFLGEVFELVGLRNIADAADESAGNYPQLSAEFILDANPDFIFLDDCCQQSFETLAARPGWDGLDAVIGRRVFQFDDDGMSRWGPRIAGLVEQLAEIVQNYLALEL